MKHLFLRELYKQTQEHIQYLKQVGLGERAEGIKIQPFYARMENSRAIDLTPFSKRTSIPKEVLDFDPLLKNTLITTDPKTPGNRPEDLNRILDIRLYPALRNLIKSKGIEIFVGTPAEMNAYYQSKGDKILYEFTIPSAAKYYLAENANKRPYVIMAGLSSRENIIAQLITLKFAGIKVEVIEIIGHVSHFTTIVRQDIKDLLQKIPALNKGQHGLIVAGCGLENRVSEIVKKHFKHGKEIKFHGNLVSLIYIPLDNSQNGIHGYLSLHLNYGEITEKITKLLLKHCHCKHVFTGGAGGYISNDSLAVKPPIGSRISIKQSMNEAGEIVSCSISRTSERMHLQISSIFLETFEWLEKAKIRGSSVDVETFYIIRAIQKYNQKHPQETVDADCGYFVSDYVGEEPLRDYSKVHHGYEIALCHFLDRSRNRVHPLSRL